MLAVTQRLLLALPSVEACNRSEATVVKDSTVSVSEDKSAGISVLDFPAFAI